MINVEEIINNVKVNLIIVIDTNTDQTKRNQAIKLLDEYETNNKDFYQILVHIYMTETVGIRKKMR